MTRRTAAHYRRMFDENPNASIGFTLAARAVYAARTDEDATDPADDDLFRAIARGLKRRYGEDLTREQVLAEMADVPQSPADELRRIREAIGLNQDAMAGRLGIHPNTLARQERGEIGIGEPTIRLARLLADRG